MFSHLVVASPANEIVIRLVHQLNPQIPIGLRNNHG